MATKKASGDKAKKGGAKKVAKKAQKKATKQRRPAAAVVAPLVVAGAVDALVRALADPRTAAPVRARVEASLAAIAPRLDVVWRARAARPPNPTTAASCKSPAGLACLPGSPSLRTRPAGLLIRPDSALSGGRRRGAR